MTKVNNIKMHKNTQIFDKWLQSCLVERIGERDRRRRERPKEGEGERGWTVQMTVQMTVQGACGQLQNVYAQIFTLKFPMKYSKNGQNFTTSKNTWNVISETCWTPCKKPHFSMWPRSRNTFFWLTPYQLLRFIPVVSWLSTLYFNIRRL